MENYFTNEIKQLRREITNLKTCGQKSAGSLETSMQSVSMSVNLQIVGSGLPVARKQFLVESDTSDLIMATLDKYYDDIMTNDHYSDPSRSAKLFIYRVDNFSARIYVLFVGNEDDYNTVIGGGTVTMSSTLTIRCTNSFTITEEL